MYVVFLPFHFLSFGECCGRCDLQPSSTSWSDCNHIVLVGSLPGSDLAETVCPFRQRAVLCVSATHASAWCRSTPYDIAQPCGHRHMRTHSDTCISAERTRVSANVRMIGSMYSLLHGDIRQRTDYCMQTCGKKYATVRTIHWRHNRFLQTAFYRNRAVPHVMWTRQ